MIRFEWDDSKAATNLKKHGVSFDEAVEVFRDPYAVTEMDTVDHGEIRWRTTGMVLERSSFSLSLTPWRTMMTRK